MQPTKILYLLIFSFLTIVVFNSCGNGSLKFGAEKPLFTLMDSTETGFFFWNEVYEKPELNALNYGYFYNGGGVAIGDINNDGLPDVYMVGNTFGGRLYINDGGLKFHQITQTSNTHTDGFTHGVTMADVNQDGLLDIYLSRTMAMVDTQRANRLFINNGDNTFTERAKEYGIDDMGFSTHSNFFDYDNDGDPDLYVLNHSINYELAMGIITQEQRTNNMRNLTPKQYTESVSKLYRNNGDGSFTDVTTQAGLKDVFFGLSATVGDLNNDGWLDLYCTSDFADQDHMYMNNGNGTFTDAIKNALGHFSQNSMGADIADMNNDGELDIITVDMMAEENYRHKQLKGNNPYDLFQMSMEYGYGCQVMRNCLQLNNGNGTYSEVGQLAGVSHTDWSWAPLFADFDNDGKKDLFVTNGYYRDITDMDYMNYESDQIIKNAGGKSNTQLIDLLNGIASNPIPNYGYRNKGDGTFEKKSDAWGLGTASFSNGAAYADLDLDGDLDLIVNNFATPSFLYRNNSIENNPANRFLSFTFLPKQHEMVQGTKVRLFTDSGLQYQQLVNNHGFLSCMQQILHFGLGKQNAVSKVEIEFPNGTIQEIKTPKLNEQIVLDITKGVAGKFEKPQAEADRFSLVDNAFSPNYFYQESDFIDFKDEPLLEQMNSNRGPFASKGDVDGDGLEDVYLSGAAGMEGSIYLQTKEGKFVQKPNSVFATDKNSEDGQSVFFDADGDNDLDLYVTSGSSEIRDENLFENRLYINDGTGVFTKSNNLPSIKTNTLSVAAIDADQDGDLDLVVGGHVVPKKYPASYPSYILRNKNGKFTADYKALPNDGMLGIINDIDQLDINSDKKTDIVLAGDWMPISILTNDGKSFKDESKKYGFENTNGMWNCIYLSDVNGDGKKDILCGNRGLNSFFTCSAENPATMYVDDFDNNGEVEAVVNYFFSDNIMYPKYSLNELLEQLPSWRGMFPRYKKYSAATSKEIFDNKKYPNMKTYLCQTFASTAFISSNEEMYSSMPLSLKSQFSPVYSIVSLEKENEILCAGNNYAVDVNQGRYDASFGSLQLWKHEIFSDHKSSWHHSIFRGEVRQLINVSNAKDKKMLLVLKANSQPMLLTY